MLAGYSYQNENENGGDPYSAGIPLNQIVTDPSLTLNGYYYDYNGSLDYPTISYDTAFFGPNFQFSPVPEPATVFSLVMICVAAAVFSLICSKPKNAWVSCGS